MEEWASAARSVTRLPAFDSCLIPRLQFLCKISQGGAVATQRTPWEAWALASEDGFSASLRWLPFGGCRSEVLRPRTEGAESASPKLRPAARPSQDRAREESQWQAGKRQPQTWSHGMRGGGGGGWGWLVQFRGSSDSRFTLGCNSWFQHEDEAVQKIESLLLPQQPFAMPSLRHMS